MTLHVKKSKGKEAEAEGENPSKYQIWLPRGIASLRDRASWRTINPNPIQQDS